MTQALPKRSGQKPIRNVFLRVEGEGLAGECIHPGDLLIVDRSLDPIAGKLVVAVLEGMLVIRQLEEGDEHLRLAQSEAPSKASGEFEVWSVVTTIIHSV